jgi:hypothetical protein
MDGEWGLMLGWNKGAELRHVTPLASWGRPELIRVPRLVLPMAAAASYDGIGGAFPAMGGAVLARSSEVALLAFIIEQSTCHRLENDETIGGEGIGENWCFACDPLTRNGRHIHLAWDLQGRWRHAETSVALFRTFPVAGPA